MVSGIRGRCISLPRPGRRRFQCLARPTLMRNGPWAPEDRGRVAIRLRAGVTTAGAATSATGACADIAVGGPEGHRGWQRAAPGMTLLAPHRADTGVTLGFVSGVLRSGLRIRRPRLSRSAAPMALAGEAIRVWAAGHLEKGREVTTSGPYAIHAPSVVPGIDRDGCRSWLSPPPTGSLLFSSSPTCVITLTAAIRTEEAHLTRSWSAIPGEPRGNE